MWFFIICGIGWFVTAVLGFLIGGDLAEGNFTGRRRRK